MTWRRIRRGEIGWETFRLRAKVLEEIRAFFRFRGFLEVDPPIAVRYPNIDPNVFSVRVADPAGRERTLFLHTSPELSMKKLLAAGSGNIFFLGKVFRDREGSPLHHAEFTMLEWYRVEEKADAIMRDVEELAAHLAQRVTGGDVLSRAGRAIALSVPWQRREVVDLFAGLLRAHPRDAAALRRVLEERGLAPGPAEEWEDLFFRAWIEVIEPALLALGTCFVTGFPASLAPLARRRAADPWTAERFEGYAGGVELVNGYEELTDPREQKARLEETARRLAEQTGKAPPIDPEFLAALGEGLPPCSGAALGVDRLVMLLLSKDDIADVTYR